MSQTDLGHFEGAGDRPSDEAEVVAGNDTAGGIAVVDEETAGLPEADGTVAFAVHQVNYTLSGYGSEEEPLIHVFGRTEDREVVHVTVRGFRPYFYAPTEEISAADLDQEAITDSEAGFVSIREEPLTRIYARTPRDVGQVRDRFRHFEADVPFPNRFLIDKGIRSGMRVPTRRRNGRIVVDHREVEPVEMDVTPRVHMVDIEVDDRSGFPEDGEEPILCLAAHDSYRDEYVAWLYVAPDGEGHRPDDLPDHELLDGGEIVEVRNFDEEAAMLNDYLEYIEETDVDLISGWNVDDFDAPYLLDRMERLDPRTDYDLSIERLSRVDEVWRDDWRGPNIKGRVVFDLLYGYRRTQFTELDSYRLDAVAEEELGESKERYTGAIGDLWEENPERLLEYNVRDVELCVEIDRKQEVIAFWNEVRTFVGCKLEDAPTPGDTVDMYILHKVHGEFVLPSRGQVEGEQYEGGAVFEPITGVREMVSVLDLASLYPMAMVTINASPETKVDPDEYEGETYRAPNDTHFRKDPDGIIRAMVDELLAEREQKKEDRDAHDPGSSEFERFDRQQAAVKVIMNCFTPDTDVLTPDGVRNIRDLAVGDPVYSLDPEAMRLEVKPVTAVHEYPEYRDELIDIQTSKIDFRVTPNHRMLVRKNDKNGITEEGWSFVEAGELDDYCHYEMPHDWSWEHADGLGETVDIVDLVRRHSDTELTISDGGTRVAAQYGIPNINREISTDVFLEFLAWFISEGSLYEANTRNHRVHIAQEDARLRSRIEGVVDRIADYYYVDSVRGVSFSSRVISDLLAELCGEKSDEKRIPELVFRGSESQKRSFLDTLLDGDGDWQKNSWRYSTNSRQLRDDILRLCTELGMSASHNRDSDVWRIYCTENAKNSFRMHRSGTVSIAENGAYCVSVADNNTLLAGRNGKYQFAGNSVYGVLGWDRFRLYDREMGAAVTATGRGVLEFTEEVAKEHGNEVIYGDTDSIMTSIGSDISKSEAIERSEELEERINAAYDEFALETLNAESHRFEIEFEKLYRRFFQAGKKKRYAGHAIWKEGKDIDDVDIVGFEYQRSDIAPITKRVQLEVIELIVRGEDLDADLERVKEYLHEEIEAFLAGDVDVDEIGIPGGIGKRLDNYESDPAHVRGAKYANTLLGTNFERGSKPKRYYLKGVHPEFFARVEAERGLDPRRDPIYGEFKADPDVICVEFADEIPEEFEIDYEKMLDKTLEGPISRVLAALDLSWEEIKSGQEQTGLGRFH